ncbi:arylsulfatase [Catenovulum agarivorans DS-2]|uniref:Arylsulfatase n=1 Tax=Catenovulum agarivorans DS-2 TaxID=1328313 RepID=W7QD14_9ALTE|nr:family 43 glycosylhydrolase [Catenovulum agarivorans]EWH09806.1 arylsulfatase [Catenovulum agarivorans DS-2]
MKIFILSMLCSLTLLSGCQQLQHSQKQQVIQPMNKSEIKSGLEKHNKALFILNNWIRDPYIILGPDDYYYLTGTTPEQDDPRQHTDPYNDGLGEDSIVGQHVRIWRSKDLIDWQYLGAPIGLADSNHQNYTGNPINKNRLWAPELHWMGDRWAIVFCPSGIATFALAQPGIEIKGPWTFPMNGDFGRKHDPSLFKDGDTWWVLSGNTQVQPLNKTLSQYTAKAKRIDPSSSRLAPNGKPITRIGHEGATIRKIGNKYVHFGTAWSTDEMRKGSYNLYYSTADKIDGPYGPRQFVGRFLGHGTPFQTRNGNWWVTAFFNGDVPTISDVNIQNKDLSETAQTINHRGTTIVPLDVKVLADGEIYIRAKDPRYAHPGPDEAQVFE